MQLRDYQTKAVSDIRAAFTRFRSVCLALQVGGGKTVIACEVMRRAIEQGRRCLFLVHRIELVEQAVERLQRFDIQPGIIKAGYDEDRRRAVQVACVPTLVRREFPHADLALIDEAHHVVSQSWMRAVGHYRGRDAWVLGITATPQRLDGRPLGDIFDTIVEPVTTLDLVRQGFLIEPRVYAPPVDLSGLKMRAGDYATLELAERMSPLCGNVIETWLERARGRRTVAFGVNVAHSKQIEQAFQARGVRARHIDGSSRPDVRREVNQALRRGDLDVVSQCQLWTEGVDIPELECLIVARPTKSLSLHRQMIGRVMRPAPGKTDALVLDHAGNHHEHGAITDEIEWSLEGRPKVEAAAPVRTCPECFAVVPANARECPECGAVLPIAETVEPSLDNPGVLQELATMEDKRIAYARLLHKASHREYKLAWARIRYKERFGVWPRFRSMEQDIYECVGHEWESKTFGPRRVTRCARCYEEVPQGV